jgi:hypothetical protein
MKKKIGRKYRKIYEKVLEKNPWEQATCVRGGSGILIRMIDVNDHLI